MSQPHLAKNGQNDIDLLETENDEADTLHHVAALRGNITAESRPQGGIELEKPGIENHSGMISNWADLAEGILNQSNFAGSHKGMG